MPRFLGIDFGLARVGLSISDSSGAIAHPLWTIPWVDEDKLVEEIVVIIMMRKISVVVIGNPISLNGKVSQMSKEVELFSKKLSIVLPKGVSINLFDERLSTKEAERVIKECGGKPSIEKNAVDAVSAAIILQAFLETVNG